jgi:hypothetical protein
MTVSHPGRPEFLTSLLWGPKNVTAFCTVILSINVIIHHHLSAPLIPLSTIFCTDLPLPCFMFQELFE